MPRSIPLILLLLTLTVTPVIAQQRAFKRPASPPASDTPGQRWAIIIGVNRYQDAAFGNLSYAVADAKTFYQTLTSIPNGFPAQNVMLLTDDAADPNRLPTHSNLIKQLSGWLRLAEPDDIALVYFAGHGFEQEGKSYLLPQDATMADLELTSLELEYVKEALRKCKARQKVFIIDACHSGAGRAPQPMSASMADALTKGIGRHGGPGLL